MNVVSDEIGDRWRRLAGSALAIVGTVLVARLLLHVIRWPFAALVEKEGEAIVTALLAFATLWLARLGSPAWRRYAAGCALFCAAYYFVLSIRLARSADWWGTREDSDVFSGLAATRGAALVLVAFAVVLLVLERRSSAAARARRTLPPR